MGNSRASSLNPLTYNQVASNDLFTIVDMSLPESKKITAGDVATYVLNNGNITASLNGTASWANTAVFALNAPTSPQVAYATSSLSSSYATSSLSSSYSKISSNSLSSSYSLTSSYAFTSVASTTFATLAANLYYDGVTPNGTASYSISSSHANNADNAMNAVNSTNAVNATTAVYSTTAVNSTTTNLVNGFGGLYAPQVVAAMSGNTSSILNNYNVNTVNSAITQSCITMSFSTTLPSSIYYVSINLSTSASYNMQKLASVLYIPFTGSVPRLLNADIIVYQ